MSSDAPAEAQPQAPAPDSSASDAAATSAASALAPRYYIQCANRMRRTLEASGHGLAALRALMLQHCCRPDTPAEAQEQLRCYVMQAGREVTTDEEALAVVVRPEVRGVGLLPLLLALQTPEESSQARLPLSMVRAASAGRAAAAAAAVAAANAAAAAEAEAEAAASAQAGTNASSTSTAASSSAQPTTENCDSSRQTQSTFVLGEIPVAPVPTAPPAPAAPAPPAAGPASSGASGSAPAPAPAPLPKGGVAAPSTATASHASTDPEVLVSAWRVRPLLDLAAESLARDLLLVPEESLSVLPPELSELVLAALSRTRAWDGEKIARARSSLFPHVEALSLAQCDTLRADTLAQVCGACEKPLIEADLSRSYHLLNLEGLVSPAPPPPATGSAVPASAPAGAGSDQAQRLSLLKTLDLDRCRRIGSAELLPVLRHVPRLETLHLSGTRVDASTLFALSSTPTPGDANKQPLCPHLTSLDVSACLLSEGLAALLNSQPRLPLRTLKISGTNFGADQLSQLDRLAPSLRTLHAQFVPRLRDACLAAVGRCTLLRVLDLSRNNNVSDEGVASLAGLRHLRRLNLAHVDVSPASTGVIAGLSNLEHLDLSYDPDVNDVMVTTLCASLPRLRVLLLTYCAGLTDAAVEGIVQHAGVLQVLKLNGCNKVGDGALRVLADRAATTPVAMEWSSSAAHRAARARNMDHRARYQGGYTEAEYDDDDDEDDEDEGDGSGAGAFPSPSPSPDPAPSSSISLRDTDSLHRTSRPLHRFPHSLLSLDLGSPRLTDACVEESLAALVPALPALQRVAIWNSAIGERKMKACVAGWKEKANANAPTGAFAVGAAEVPPVTPQQQDQDPAAAAAADVRPLGSPLAVSASDSSSSAASAPSPSPSVWLLDESMKTAPGTFILVRRSPLESSPLAASPFQWAGPSPSLDGVARAYGIEHWANLARSNRRKKTVSWAPVLEQMFFQPDGEAAAGDADEARQGENAARGQEEEEEEECGSVRGDDEDGGSDDESLVHSRHSIDEGDEDNSDGEEEQSSVIRNDDDDDESQANSAESSVIRSEPDEAADAALVMQFRASAL